MPNKHRSAGIGPDLALGFLVALFALFISSGGGFATRAHAEASRVATAPSAPPATPQTLESLMALLANSGGVDAHFKELRLLSILNEPIESRGKLYFAPPDWLARHVTEPGEAKIVVRDDRVFFRDETGVQILELGTSEVARAMVGNVSVLMRGDLEALNRGYSVGFEADGDRWTLELEPRDRVVRQLIERLRVNGHGNALVRMESIETSGDVTVTEFSDVKVGVEFSPQARAQIFSVEPVSSTPSKEPGTQASTAVAPPP